ncbi:MAG TPA: pirin family protein [Oscillatoriaceae cyanobacterium]
MTLRTVKRLHEALRDDIMDLQTRRPVPGPTIDQVDPFLFLNHHGPQTYPANNHGLPFGPHPHRGFETVTFILEGDLMHQDSGGHQSVIMAGGIQWMTAGRGLIHSELSSPEFLRQGGPLEILQLWVNLPARLKMTATRYVGLQRDQLPAVVSDDGKVTVNLIAGDWQGQQGPVQPLTDIQIMTIELKAGGRVVFPVPQAHSVFLYVVRGEVDVDGTAARGFQLVELEQDGDEVAIAARTDAVLLFGHATPYGEPVVAHGPFVMNTRAEIMQAIQDYQAGKFGPGI